MHIKQPRYSKNADDDKILSHLSYDAYHSHVETDLCQYVELIAVSTSENTGLDEKYYHDMYINAQVFLQHV